MLVEISAASYPREADKFKLCGAIRKGFDKFDRYILFAKLLRVETDHNRTRAIVRLYWVSTILRNVRQHIASVSYQLPEGYVEGLAISPCGHIIGNTLAENIRSLFALGLFGQRIKTHAAENITEIAVMGAGFWRVTTSGEPKKHNYVLDGGEIKISRGSLEVVPVDQFKRPGTFEMVALGLYMLTFADMSQYAYTVVRSGVLVTESFDTSGNITQAVTPNGAIIFYNHTLLAISVQFLQWKRGRVMLQFVRLSETALPFESIEVECAGRLIFLTNMSGWSCSGDFEAYAAEKITNAIHALEVE